MPVFINERRADMVKSDLISTSNDWLETQKGIYPTNAIYFEDNCGFSKELQRNTEVWFKIMDSVVKHSNL